MCVGERGNTLAGADEGGAGGGDRIARDEHECGVDDVLARRSPVHGVRPRPGLCSELDDEFDHRVAVSSGAPDERAAIEGLDIEGDRVVTPRADERTLDPHHGAEYSVVARERRVANRFEQPPVVGAQRSAGHTATVLTSRRRSR